jgi:hypothetical protein
MVGQTLKLKKFHILHVEIPKIETEQENKQEHRSIRPTSDISNPTRTNSTQKSYCLSALLVTTPELQ